MMNDCLFIFTTVLRLVGISVLTADSWFGSCISKETGRGTLTISTEHILFLFLLLLSEPNTQQRLHLRWLVCVIIVSSHKQRGERKVVGSVQVCYACRIFGEKK
jgi:hypothetical protein